MSPYPTVHAVMGAAAIARSFAAGPG